MQFLNNSDGYEATSAKLIVAYRQLQGDMVAP